MSALKQRLQQQQQLKLAPHQIQLMRMIQLPAQALEQRIKEEIESNPALEENPDEAEEEQAEQTEENESENALDEAGDQDENNSKSEEDEFDVSDYVEEDEIPAYRLTTNNKGPDEEFKVTPHAVQRTFQDFLIDQLGTKELDNRQYLIGEYILGNFDDDGYLRRDIQSIAEDLAFTQNMEVTVEEVEKVLNVIMEFDPPGIGARNLQECLLIQLKRKKEDLEKNPSHNNGFEIPLKIVTDYFDEFTKKNYFKIGKELGLSNESLKNAIDIITHLNPRPGGSTSDSGSGTAVQVIPDFIITNNDNELELSLSSSNLPELYLSKTYKQMLMEYSPKKNKTNASNRQAFNFIKDKIGNAQLFIEMIKERYNTLTRTMTAIMEYQKEYFLTGDETKFKPMILKDIAKITGYDLSTVSRVSNSKYVQTPFGTFPVKNFFSESLQSGSGEEVSSKKFKNLLRELIENENKKKPLADDVLSRLMKEKGYPIARRTVAKYREMLKIAPARLRKKL